MKTLQRAPIWVIPLAIAALLASCSGSSGAPRVAPPTSNSVDATAADRTLSGVTLPRSAPGTVYRSIESFEDELGTSVDIAHYFKTWNENVATSDIVELWNHGLYPMISWNAINIPAIADGQEDDKLRHVARALAATGVPVLLRFRWEMDRPNLQEHIQSPRLYIAAWQRAHRIFQQEGAKRVSWVWCPTADGFFEGGTASAYFPGDKSVDWLCADAYPDKSLQPLGTLLQPFLRWASSHPQPVMIGEFGVPRTASDLRRAQWIRAATQFLLPRPKVKAVVYFNLDVNRSAKILQYGINDSTQTLEAFKYMVTELRQEKN